MHHKRNNKESITYVQGLRPFGNTLPRGLKGILKKNGYNYSEIISKWKSFKNKEIVNFCYPKSIKMDKSNKKGILIVSVDRGNEINVEYSKKEIMNKINSYFGYQLISDIKLKANNIKIKNEKSANSLVKINSNFNSKINEIKSKKIRDSLSQLIKSAKK